MAKRQQARQVKPKHELRTAYGRPYCWACTATLGERTFPCKNEYSDLTPQQQREFFRKHHLCGRCGQPATTHKPLCKCRQGACGCWELHNEPVNIPDQLDLFSSLEAPQGLRRGKDFLNPG